MAWRGAWPPWPVQAGQIGRRPNDGGRFRQVSPNGAARLRFPPPEGRDAVLAPSGVSATPKAAPKRLAAGFGLAHLLHYFSITCSKSRAKCANRARFVPPLFPNPGFSPGLKDRKCHTAPTHRSWNASPQGRTDPKTVLRSARYSAFLAACPAGMVLPAGWRRRTGDPHTAFPMAGKGFRRAPPSRPPGRSMPPAAFHHATEKPRY